MHMHYEIPFNFKCICPVCTSHVSLELPILLDIQTLYLHLNPGLPW